MVETGFTRAKNAAHTFGMNFMGMASRCSRTGRSVRAPGAALGPMATLALRKLNQEFALPSAASRGGYWSQRSS